MFYENEAKGPGTLPRASCLFENTDFVNFLYILKLRMLRKKFRAEFSAIAQNNLNGERPELTVFNKYFPDSNISTVPVFPGQSRF